MFFPAKKETEKLIIALRRMCSQLYFHVTEILLALHMHGEKKLNVDQICTWSAEARVGNNNGIEGTAVPYPLASSRLEIESEKRPISTCPYENDSNSIPREASHT